MPTFSIEGISTHAELDATGKLVQWAEVRLLFPKDFDFRARGPELLKKLEAERNRCFIAAPFPR